MRTRAKALYGGGMMDLGPVDRGGSGPCKGNPALNIMIDATENITFPQLRWRAVTMDMTSVEQRSQGTRYYEVAELRCFNRLRERERGYSNKYQCRV